MSVYKSISDVAELKYRMDRAGISEFDRAVVLDATDWAASQHTGTTVILGFRIIWRKPAEYRVGAL